MIFNAVCRCPHATLGWWTSEAPWRRPGFYTGSNIELVLLGRRGKPFKHAQGCKASQVVYAPLGKHSAKPEEIQRRIEWMYPHVTPRLEMFARRDREGWLCLGNEGVAEPEDIRISLEKLAKAIERK